MIDLANFLVCSWDTASADAAGHSAAMREAGAHPGAALVETCQRVEAISIGVCAAGCSTTRQGEDAFRYLVRVAAGLESIVLGESEVVGQVREAAAAAPSDVAHVIRRALAAARAFRAAQGFATDSGWLFDLAVAEFDQAPESVLIAGSGPTARCLVRRVSSLGAARVRVVSRARPAWVDHEAVAWAPLAEIAGGPAADVALVCLGGDAPVLARGDVPAAIVVDVSTPRRTTDGASGVITLRHLRDRATRTEEDERTRLGRLLDAEVERVLTGWREDATSPIGRFRQAVEMRRLEALPRLTEMYPGVPAELLDQISRSLLNRVLHDPSVRLREAEDTLADAFANLFERGDP